MPAITFLTLFINFPIIFRAPGPDRRSRERLHTQDNPAAYAGFAKKKSAFLQKYNKSNRNFDSSQHLFLIPFNQDTVDWFAHFSP